MLINQETSAPVEADVPPATSSPAADDPSAAPSAAQTENEAPPSLLDVVKNAVEPQEEDGATEASSAPDAEKSDTDASADPEDTSEDEESYDGLPFSRHPRFQKLVKQRKEFKAKAEDLEARMEPLQQDAGRWANVTTFMQQNDISNDEMLDLFKFGALFKSDAGKALEMLRPYMDDLFRRTGIALPDDLSQAVEEGEITEARARELSRARAAQAEADARATRVEERSQARDTERQVADRQAVILGAINDWEAAKKGKDPDFDAKQPLLADRTRALIAAQGQPQTREEAQAILDEAYRQVTDHLKRFVPARPEVKRPTTSAPSANATAAPKSVLEAVSRAVNQAV